MTDAEFLAQVVQQLLNLQNIVKEQQAHVLTLEAYLREQSFYDGSRFGTLFREYRQDALGKVQQDLEASRSALLALLRDFPGSAH